jgi:hypothetical protein
MKTLPIKLLALSAAFAFAGCSTVTVTTDYDRSVSFAKYRSYSLSPAARGQTLSPSSEAALRESLRTKLAERGIGQVQSGKADLAVVRHVFTQEKLAVQQYTDWGYGSSAWPYGYGYYSPWAGAPMTYTDVHQYTEGTLVLDFVDTRTKKLVFRGVGQAVVSGPESNAGKIQEAVEKIVEKLPLPAR